MFLGIDAGSTHYKLVWVEEGGVVNRRMLPTKPSLEDAVREIVQFNPPERIVATGYGRHWLIKAQIAQKAITEIKAQALGVGLRDGTVLDLGGQDFKVIKIKEGRVSDFEMNDRCAAGTGRFLEMAAKRLDLSLKELDLMACGAKDGARLNSMCAVFAESELVSLMARGVSVESIARGVFLSIAQRLVSMVKRMDGGPPFIFTGGGAMFETLVELVAQQLGHEMTVPENPLFTAALGAALVAAEDA